MSEHFKLNQRVEIIGKDVQGVIAFYGQTKFASGKWIGVVLDEPKGKNNGSVLGEIYFECEENHGMFVRPLQVAPLDEHGRRIEAVGTSPGDASSKPRVRQSTVRRKTSPQKSVSSMSASSSRISLASSRQSLIGSRQSLAGSRQSLSDSHSHLASPNVEKLGDSESPSQIPKRASFIETGFVETLKPQFTPGQVLTSTQTSAAVEEKLSHLQLQQEFDNRNRHVKDLEEKLETLKIKRQEDKDKLKDYDKQKIQLEHLVEFKNKIMESQARLQRELQKAKQEAKDAIEAREIHAEEMADLADTVEMATLDKEMAEEKAETLQIELDASKEKLEEVTLDLEILKNEMQERAAGMETKEGELVSTYEMKQLKQQNARLRETLVKMRDLSAHEKHEYQKLLKDIDQKHSEITELGRTKEKLSSRVEQMEQQIADLQEQVDAALGAEEMLVFLGEQKITLEDKVVALVQEVFDLETLQEMNDELVESNAELEADLREELDLANGAIREALRDRDAALETIADREATIGKFRELVQKLQEQSLDLQHRLEKATSKPISTLPEIMDFKKMFTETKAHTKAIDLELRHLDVQQSQEHIKYLSSFMPDIFLNRGGDHDAVLVLLLVPRLIYKSQILVGQIAAKFPAVDKIDRAAIIKGHSVEQFSFRCRFSYYIYALQAILHQYLHSLNICKPDTLLKVGSSYPEIAAQEKIIDGFVVLVKRDQLDENIHSEAIEKCVHYFNTLYPILLGVDNYQNHCMLLSDNIKSLTSACDGINTDASVIRNLIEAANIGDIGLLMQYIITSIEQLQQQLKQVKRRLPADPNITDLGLNNEVAENLFHCYQHAGKIIKMLHDIVKNSIQVVSTVGDADKGISQEKIGDLAMNASDKVYEQDDLGPVQSVKNSLAFIVTQVTQISQFLQDNEYNIATSNKKDEKVLAPIQIRAQIVKKEMEETKTLTSKLENKESDIKELRRVLKEKQEQLSEMTIRKELAEKKLGNVNKDYEVTIEKLQRKLDESFNNYKKKEKEFEETLDHLQSDIDSLENEKGEMKEKLKIFSKKNVLDGSQLSSLQSLGPNLPALVRDSPLLLQEIDSLRRLFRSERDHRINLQNEQMLVQLKALKPLPTFNTRPDETLDSLVKEGAALKQDILLTLATPKFPSMCKVKPGNGPATWQKHFAEERDKMLSLKRRAADFQSRVAEEIVKRKFGGQIETDFTVFPTVEMVKALNESRPVNIGSVRIPKPYMAAHQKPGIVNLELDFENLQRLLGTLIC